MFIELNACFEFVSLFINAYDKNLGFQKDDNETILDIAYLIFFMGIGKSSDKLITISLKDRCDEIFLTQLIKYLNTEVKEQFRTGRRNFSLPADGYQPKYMPFDGHMTRLGHYYRHLYQTVGFIANQDNELINESGKCEYAKTLRAQLSDYEQLILFYNANSSLGKSWIKEGYLKRFRMIKNMPVPLADFGVNPYIKFKNEIEYWKTMKKSFFEWDDRK